MRHATSTRVDEPRSSAAGTKQHAGIGKWYLEVPKSLIGFSRLVPDEPLVSPGTWAFRQPRWHAGNDAEVVPRKWQWLPRFQRDEPLGTHWGVVALLSLAMQTGQQTQTPLKGWSTRKSHPADKSWAPNPGLVCRGPISNTVAPTTANAPTASFSAMVHAHKLVTRSGQDKNRTREQSFSLRAYKLP